MELCEALGQRETQAGSVLVAGTSAVDLLELPEHTLLVGFSEEAYRQVLGEKG